MDGFSLSRLLLAALLIGPLAACSPVRQTDPPQTATEQLLISRAVENAVGNMQPTIPKGTTCFLDTTYFDTDGSIILPKYTIGTVHSRLAEIGCKMVDDRKAADVVVAMRTGAQSIDQHSWLIGVPSLPLPIPFAGAITTPEIALFKYDVQRGISKLAVTAIAKDGSLVASTGPTFGESHLKHYVVLLFGFSHSNFYYDDPNSGAKPPPAP